MLTSHLEAARGLIWDRPRNLDFWSDDGAAPELALLSPSFRGALAGGDLAHGVGSMVHRARARAGFSEESGFEPGALRLRGRDLATRPLRPPVTLKVIHMLNKYRF
ncbi:hypothetical protein AVEN_202922-1 [Araneus ventricosus]|uniref:Uncharacterized protein n=2 Tax=Araneus ventricosus TaxID=182803 RepID=A0A4Y2MYV7_ARAVE|nr:hypothetical protein AVEN_72707-1 [Araneus ventricosus]GBM10325.1 hypothetical protein AVEN_137722-1 [Araneus ventricosus]GBN31752.1 hypothetical protein AVEN_189179-1 [Araneus ventricosus]GBN31756.1 hypothetical protein AVEN_201330-1 [Araneus ventricosus]GBN32261.1 hypothetical protein AVEN_202922-1 [Araneus ventricosus]